MIQNKKILLICKEDYSIPLYFLANKLRNENEVAAFFIHPEESFYNKSKYNQLTYYLFKETLQNVKVYDLKNLCEQFKSSHADLHLCMEYLRSIEKEYTNFKNLNLQLISSQLTTRHYHERYYIKRTTHEQNIKFLELGYKRVIEVIDEFKPDMIIDLEDAELLRTIINEVSYVKQIPYITIDYPRLELYKIPTFNLGLFTENYFKWEVEKYYQLSDDVLSEEIKYVSSFREKKEIMSKEFSGTITSQYKPDNIITTTKFLVGMLIFFFYHCILSKNLLKIKSGGILFTNPFKHFIFYVETQFKKQMLYRRNKIFEPPRIDEDYVYMPLHVIPESTTFVKSPFYINELALVEQISKSLPVGWKLYVKEHQAMVGERSLSFYKSIKKIPNVRLVQFNYYDDPKPWIECAKGVITISGTAAYEAVMMGKKSIIFTDVPFSQIDGVSIVRSFDELPNLIAKLGKIDNIKSCAAYIAAVKSVGMEINIKYLITEGVDILRGVKKISDKFNNSIDTLETFYERAIKHYLNNSKEYDKGVK